MIGYEPEVCNNPLTTEIRDDDDDFRPQLWAVVIRIVVIAILLSRQHADAVPSIIVTGGLTGAATTAAGIVPEHWDVVSLSLLSVGVVNEIRITSTNHLE